MRMVLTVLGPARGVSTDVLIDAAGETPVRAVSHALARYLGTRGEPALSVDGRPVDGDLEIRRSPLLDGAVVALGSAATGDGAPADPIGLTEVRVVSGPGAGTARRLGPGEFLVGSAAGCAIRLADRNVADVALRLVVGADGSCAVIPSATSQPGEVLLDGVPLPATGRLLAVPSVDQDGGAPARTDVSREIGLLAVGAVLLAVTVPGRPDGPARPAAAGRRLEVHRPPRLAPTATPTRVDLPARPVPPRRQRPPLLMAVLPLVAGLGAAWYLRSLYPLMFALFSPLSLVVSSLTGARQSRQEHRADLAVYQRGLAEAEESVRAAVAREAAARRAADPDPAAVSLTARGRGLRLWERRPGDDDFLRLRVGTADLPGSVTVARPGAPDEQPALPDVPVTVRLPELGVVGIAGRGALPRVLGAWLVVQAAVLHSPGDLAIYLLAGAGGQAAWGWSRWLPHARPGDGAAGPAALVGNDQATRAARLSELAALVTARRAAGAGAEPGPAALVVLDGLQGLRGLPGLGVVLRDGPTVGVFCLCLEREISRLPSECGVVIDGMPTGLRVSPARGGQGRLAVTGVRPDLVAAGASGEGDGWADDPVADTSRWCDAVARALAPLRDCDAGGAAPDALPPTARLLDLLDLEPPSAGAVADRWRAAPQGDTSFPAGAGTDGPVVLDLRRDGPHALVAGTTGSGKSELLQSVVAALAAANRPDLLTFVLVDYKGGAAFADCADLPHCLGVVTDLDGPLADRVLRSLGADLRRRERVLAAARARDLDAYLDLAGRPGRGLEPLARLVIVVDEFAVLVRERPAFVDGLVDLARRGRSLGVHLVLATQRPAGVLSAEIRANTNLRIGLRMTDTDESADVLGAPDAALLARAVPGRALARLGHGSPLVPFQAARVGGHRPAVASAAAPWVAPVPWESLGSPLPARPVTGPADDPPTDLRRLVAAVRQAAALAGVTPPPPPWLAPLGPVVTLAGLGVRPDPAPPRRLPPVPVGVSDRPDDQSRELFTVDLEAGGHVLVVGSARSGRSTLLRTFAGALAATVATRDAHLFGLDCGNNALLALRALPHTGAVVSADEPDRVRRLLARLRAEVAARQAVFAAPGFADLAEQRAAEPAAALPYLVLLLDRWEGFLAAFEEVDAGQTVDDLCGLLREGAAVGLRVVVTADRRGLAGRLAGAVERRLVLRLADRGDYALAGLAGVAVSEAPPPGRGFAAGGDEATWRETQVALLDPDPSGPAQVAALARLGAWAAARDGVAAGAGPGPQPDPRRPMRVDALPARVTLAEATAREPRWTPGPLRALLGLGGDELVAVGVDLAEAGPGFTVAGPPRSGRSCALVTLARTLLTGPTRLVLVAARRSPLRALADADGVAALLTDPNAPTQLSAALDGLEDMPVAVVVDDADALALSPLGGALAEYGRRAGETGSALVVAATTDELITAQYRDDLLAVARRGGAGLLLWPSPGDDALFSTARPRGGGGGPRRPGRGVLMGADGRVPVQVAWPGDLPAIAGRPPPPRGALPVSPATTDLVRSPLCEP